MEFLFDIIGQQRLYLLTCVINHDTENNYKNILVFTYELSCYTFHTWANEYADNNNIIVGCSSWN